MVVVDSRALLRRALVFLALLPAASAASDSGRLVLPRASTGIDVDGDPREPVWGAALVIDTFYETAFGDNRTPGVRTVARLMYDERYFYVAVECDDPAPGNIRAPFVDRDNVFGDQDNFVVFLDPYNDNRTAQEFRVNPRGIQGDALYYDANGNEDFAPDFYYDAAARITDRGWTAEMRIPFSSLRYPKSDPQTWGLLLWRNYPREYRYLIYSSPLPRNSNCLLCHSGELDGLARLPRSAHLVLAPYVSGQRVDEAPASAAPLTQGDLEPDAGLDLKWAPGTATALDLTVNPDFSQVEADVAQIAVNNRFALFYPEKRPFFLEGIDLFDTPISAVYTRTITSPRWGGRATGRFGETSYTILAAEDRGGGSVILPGPTSSSLADQDYRSYVGIARVRRELGSSFLSGLYTGREIEGGGYNRVIGPDFQWRPGAVDVVTAQFLWSETETPMRPDLAPEWDGRRLEGHALEASWAHTPEKWDTIARYRDVADGFRADQGFVPQVGYRRASAEGGLGFYPAESFLTRLRPFAFGEYSTDSTESLLTRSYGAGIGFTGKRNLVGSFAATWSTARTGEELLDRTYVPFQLRIDPSRWLTRISVSGEVGEDIDVVNARVGRGGFVSANVILRPTSHLTLDLLSSWQWLDVDTPAGGTARLFTAQVERVKMVYNFSARLYLRLIGEYLDEKRDPSLYDVPPASRAGGFSGSALLAYRLNWQTALFLGYGDDREELVTGRLVPLARQFFAKLSYSFQR
jgi:hypothetical protein